MNMTMEKFDSGWIGLSLELNESEIDKLMIRLTELKNRNIGHFHIRNEDFSAETGIADLELSLSESDGIGNMSVE
jgi:hypothetical protein